MFANCPSLLSLNSQIPIALFSLSLSLNLMPLSPLFFGAHIIKIGQAQIPFRLQSQPISFPWLLFFWHRSRPPIHHSRIWIPSDSNFDLSWIVRSVFWVVMGCVLLSFIGCLIVTMVGCCWVLWGAEVVGCGSGCWWCAFTGLFCWAAVVLVVLCLLMGFCGREEERGSYGRKEKNG